MIVFYGDNYLTCNVLKSFVIQFWLIYHITRPHSTWVLQRVGLSKVCNQELKTTLYGGNMCMVTEMIPVERPGHTLHKFNAGLDDLKGLTKSPDTKVIQKHNLMNV